ncbi:MAG: DMT family transporter [Catenulispora sp.]
MATEVRTRPAESARPAAAGRAQAQLVLTMALWGSGFVVSKKAVEQMPHSVAAVIRFGSGAVVLLLVLAVLRGGRIRVDRSQLGPLLLAGVLGTGVYNAVLFFGLSRAPAIDGTIIVPVLSPILTTAAALALRWDRPQRRRVAGLLLGACGAAVFLLGAAGPGAGHGRLSGDLAYVAAAASWSAYTLVGKKILAGVEPFTATAVSMAFGALLLAALAVPDLGRVAWHALPGSFYTTMAYLVLFPTAVAYGLFYVGVRAVGPTTASVLMFLVPVSGTALAWLLLGESADGAQLIGSAAMLAGALAATVAPGSRGRDG